MAAPSYPRRRIHPIKKSEEIWQKNQKKFGKKLDKHRKMLYNSIGV